MRLGRYVLHECIASGGMASVHLARMLGPAGFARTVAIKRLHPHLARDPEFAKMFLDEARLACRIHHPNVVSTLDVVVNRRELFLVMDYVLGPSVSHLTRILAPRGETIPLGVAAAIMSDVLHGLHAAHEAVTENGEPLCIVHRDVSPQNVLVGADGVIRIVDFGIAKASSRLQSTQGGVIKGKLAYAAPEQLLRTAIDRRCDVYSAGVVFWEILAGRKLFVGDDPPSQIGAVLENDIPPVSSVQPSLPKGLDAVIARATAYDASSRFASALDFAAAIEAVIAPAPAREVAEWLSRVAGALVAESRAVVRSVEQTPTDQGSVDAEHDADDEHEAFDGIIDAQKTSAADTVKWDVAPSAPRRRARRAAIVLGMLLVVAFALATIGTVRWTRSSEGETSPKTATTVSAPVGSPALASSVAGSPALSSSVEPPPPPQVVASSAAPGPAGSPVSGPRRTAPPGPRKAAGSSTTGRARDDCQPNFTIDANGVKRFKPSCI